ncbi:MAG: SRPBCC domain-containing protein [Chloroflexi bacterium]|nr:SRPBCC domain-containing protein [Chloroflexota bacterium]
MATPEIMVETEIRAPLEKVFAFVCDVDTHPLYAQFVESVKITSPVRCGVGVTFVQRQRRDGSVAEINSEITEVIPLRKIVWLSRGQIGEALVSYVFEPALQGTKVIHSVATSLYEDPQQRRKSIEENEQELATLKRLMER